MNFLNADLIAQGLSPLDARTAALKAGRLLLAEFHFFVSRHETFAFESTLSGASYVRLFKQAKRHGFKLYIHYLWLPHTGNCRCPCPQTGENGRAQCTAV